MDLEKFLISICVFIFSVFLFPTLTNQIGDASITSNIGTVIKVFPIIFLVVSAAFSIYYGLKDVK